MSEKRQLSQFNGGENIISAQTLLSALSGRVGQC